MQKTTDEWFSKRCSLQKYYALVLVVITIISAAWTVKQFYYIAEIWQLNAICASQSQINDATKACNSLVFSNIFNIILSLLFLCLFLIILCLAFALEKKYISYVLKIGSNKISP